MKEKQNKFRVDFLDHVALRVSDPEASAEWYEEVLGLNRYQLPEWGDLPIFLLAGKSGIALFQSDPNDPPTEPSSRNIKIDHFAFQVSPENFELAQERYRELGLSYEIQDHIYFESIYTKDPDGHILELTCLKLSPEKFYRNED